MQKKVTLSMAAILGLVPMVGLAQRQCFAEEKIVWISAGYVDIRTSKGPDGGDAVYFQLENGATYPLHYSYNLDHDKGQALHRMLTAALVGQHRITGYDHYGTMCDDIDQITIHR